MTSTGAGGLPGVPEAEKPTQQHILRTSHSGPLVDTPGRYSQVQRDPERERSEQGLQWFPVFFKRSEKWQFPTASQEGGKS